MRDKEVAFLSILGLLWGTTSLIVGDTTMYACPAQLVGQPSNCLPSGYFAVYIAIPVVAVVVSIIGLAYSLLPQPRPGLR